MNHGDVVQSILKEINEDLVTYQGSNMLADGLVDSFEIVDIIERLEKMFGIEIDGSMVVAENFANKDTITALVGKILDER